MKRYKFNLEPLLFQRATLEEQAQQELAEQNRLLKEIQDKLTTLFDEYQTHCKHRPSVTTPAELELANNYTNVLLERIETARNEVRRQREAVEKVKAKLLKLHQDKKVVERLKEKDVKAYQTEIRREETKILDEFTSIRHARNEGGKR